MNFLNPWLLIGGLGIAVPIIIHLLNRFRRRRMDWAAMDLLRRAIVMRSRQIQIEDLILLLLRCLAVLLIALSMARPTITASGAKWFGGEEQVAAVIAIDGSYSMDYRPGANSRFERAIQSVREIQKTLNPGDPVSLVILGDEPRILLRNMAYDPRRFEKALEEAAPLPERLNLELCLEHLATLVREMKAPVRECYLVTDAQTVTWGDLSDKARSTLHDLGAVANVFFLSTAADSGANLAVTNFVHASGALRKGGAARYVAEVRNNGTRPQQQVTVSLLRGDTPIDQRIVERIEAGQVQGVPLFVRFDEPGCVRLTARIGRDPLTVDNSRHAVARVLERVKVLLVDGDPSSRPFQNETDYLLTALLPRRGPASGSSLEVTRVSWLELAARRPAEYDVVMLANLPGLREEQVERLYSFVQAGGGLMIFLGDRVNPNALNAQMQQADGSLLPGELQSLATAPAEAEEGWVLQATGPDHPVSMVLKYVPAALLNEARVRRLYRVAAAPEARTILEAAGAAPLLLEKPIGQGKVLLFTSTADRAWTNLPAHPAFPILLHEAVTYLTTRAHERALTVGERLAVPLPRQSVQTSVTFREPGGKELPVQVTERDGRRVADYGQPRQPGFYEVTHAADGEPMLVAVNVDPRESDVRILQGADIETALVGLPVRRLSEEQNLAVMIRESRVGRELWRILMIVGLCVLLLEAFLAQHFSRRIVAAEAAEPEGASPGVLTAGGER